MDKQLKDKLNTATKTDLARWWADINKFRLPSELEGFGLHFVEDERSIVGGSEVMNYITKIIGLKECLRAWNCDEHLHMPMTDAEFEKWWEDHGKSGWLSGETLETT